MYAIEDNFEGSEVENLCKIEGKDVAPIVQKLAKLAVDSPEICVWDFNMLNAEWGMPFSNDQMLIGMARYFEMDKDVLEKECDKIIAKSGADLGDNNLYFEWLTSPTGDQLRRLRRKIDNVLKPFNNKYTVTNSK